MWMLVGEQVVRKRVWQQRCLLLTINRDYQQGIEYLPVNVSHILMHNIVALNINYLLLFCYSCWYTEDLAENILRAGKCG